ncbi:MAG: hypothetical protein SWH68_02565 [Thermodesulfobacteriota bacterium]|nr:hypothetical protein [Thermodesulfobacteriota bacterium]
MAKDTVYMALMSDRQLAERVAEARRRLAACELRPRQCGVNRLAGETGICQTGAQAMVAGYNAHFGEEAPLVGRNGSGTIFFSYCNLMCEGGARPGGWS